MAKFLSNRQKNLKVGISSYSENLTSLEVIGNVGIATTNATSRLWVAGDGYFTGVVTASSFSGNVLTATYATSAGVSTSVIGGISSVTQLNVTGVSTFTNGPVFIGSGVTTGTALQRLQVTGGAYVSGTVGVGTTNPRENLDVIGSIGIQSASSANRFQIQHNAALNSLDFIFV